MFSIEIYKLNRNGTERTSGKAGVGDGGRAPRPADALLVVRWAGRCGERTERCQWQRKRSERVAAVKILSVRRKAAQKFWAPQQDHGPLRRGYKRCNGRATARVAPTKALQGVRRGERNPPVTASPCQPLLGKGAGETGDADCHTSDIGHWFAMTGYKKCSEAGRCGERTERCRWQRKRSERVAAVKIFSVRRKAAQKFWAPQQDHRPLRSWL